VGHSCPELCATLHGGTEPSCDECLVRRVLALRQPAGQDVVVIEGGEERRVRIAAAPINDLAGRAQEVIVTFQDAGPAARAAA
jgi:hypothetical protein